MGIDADDFGDVRSADRLPLSLHVGHALNVAGKRWGAGWMVACWVAGCVSHPPASGPSELCAEVERFFRTDLEGYQKGVDEASRQYGEEQWKVETADPQASRSALSQSFERWQKRVYDTVTLDRARKLSQQVAGLPPKECAWVPKLKRAVEILSASILTKPELIAKEKLNQDRQDALEGHSNDFRIPMGTEAPISKALFLKKLSSTRDRIKREAWYHKWGAERAKKWMEWGFRDLIAGRNEEAKLAGFSTYYEYRFFRAQLDLNRYRTLVQDLKTKLAPAVKQWFREWGRGQKISQVRAWDMGYLREKALSGPLNEWLKGKSVEFPMEAARAFYAVFGFDIDGYKLKMDLWPRSGKTAHAFAFTLIFPRVDWSGQLALEPKADIRFLANLKAPIQWEDIRTTIHELGHAVHSAEVRQPIGVFRGTDSLETEAVAQLFERLAGAPDFLESALASTSGRAKGIIARQQQAFRIEQALTLLRQVFFSDFEYELYHRPSADWRKLWSSLHKEYWGVEVEPQQAGWDIEHFVVAPVYVQNYAIGILMVEQLKASLERDFKLVRSPEVGAKLRQMYFSPGQEYGYQDLIHRFTGAPLSATAALNLGTED